MAVESAEGPGKSKIVEAAKAAWEAAKGKPYTWGGHSTNGFDCSGYVCYVFRKAYEPQAFSNVTAGQLFVDSRFEDVSGTPQYGDLICFKKSDGAAHDHVGIVLNSSEWIGAQSSTGVAPVKFSNVYWSAIKHSFRRFCQ